MQRVCSALTAFVLGLTLTVAAQQAAVAVDPNRWEETIRKFEAEDAAHAPAKGGVLFIGASSIARWSNLAESFPDLKTVNRGFGGSEMADSVKYATRVIVPHAPRIVVLYAGENDLNRGVTPAKIDADFNKFYDIVHKALPSTRIVVIGLKPSLLRWKLRDGMHDANKLIESSCRSKAGCAYVDPWPVMIDKDGTPRPELFVADGLHMTPEGYKEWTKLLRPYLK
jgi:lysophospholipase L1-like esterase